MQKGTTALFCGKLQRVRWVRNLIVTFASFPERRRAPAVSGSETETAACGEDLLQIFPPAFRKKEAADAARKIHSRQQ